MMHVRKRVSPDGMSGKAVKAAHIKPQPIHFEHDGSPISNPWDGFNGPGFARYLVLVSHFSRGDF